MICCFYVCVCARQSRVFDNQTQAIWILCKYAATDAIYTLSGTGNDGVSLYYDPLGDNLNDMFANA